MDRLFPLSQVISVQFTSINFYLNASYELDIVFYWFAEGIKTEPPTLREDSPLRKQRLR